MAKRVIMLIVLFAFFVLYVPFTSYHQTSFQSDVTFLKPVYGQTSDIGSLDQSLRDNSTDISNSTDTSGTNNGTDITNQKDDLGGPNTIPDVSSDIVNPVENTTAANGTLANPTANQTVPEFGSVSVLVLIAAIASIILISAKTGLRLDPRY
ncbi:MAG: PEFG-CTERM sorting domain-containing protein [Thaumarchaeota archaeon]|nr:PEFG-CTERM sorting domain-containing protein [Nitrososphaerota archaeon]